jgi:hypothetical protein
MYRQLPGFMVLAVYITATPRPPAFKKKSKRTASPELNSKRTASSIQTKKAGVQARQADFFYLIPTGLANLLSKPLDSHRPGQFT